MLFYQKHHFSAKQDAEIERVYRERTRGGNKALAFKYGVSPSLVSQRAAQLGCQPLFRTNNRNHPATWTPAELRIVRKNLGQPIQSIRAALAHHHYRRDAAAIMALLYRKRLSGEWPTREDQMMDGGCYSVQDVVAGIGFSRDQVQRWIERDWLPATKLGGGVGLYSIRREDLRDALQQYVAHWDHTRSDKWFLLEVLCSQPYRPKLQRSAGISGSVAGSNAGALSVGLD